MDRTRGNPLVVAAAVFLAAFVTVLALETLVFGDPLGRSLVRGIVLGLAYAVPFYVLWERSAGGTR